MRFVVLEQALLELKNKINDFKEQQGDYINEVQNLNHDNLIASSELSKKKKIKKTTDEKLLEFLKEKIEDIGITEYFHVDLYNLKQNLGAYTVTELNIFNNALNSIVSKVDLIFHIQSLSSPSKEKYNYIYAVKLPEYEYFDEVSEFTKKLNYVFSTIMSDNRKVMLVGFDRGSEWYQVALENIVDFKIMALFISEVTRWVRFVIEDKRREKEITVEDDARRLILENMKANQMMIKDYAVKRVLDKRGISESHEEYSKFQIAFERMAELMIKGTKVEIDKQKLNDVSEKENETTVELLKLEDIQVLLESYSDSLIEYNPVEEE